MRYLSLPLRQLGDTPPQGAELLLVLFGLLLLALQVGAQRAQLPLHLGFDRRQLTELPFLLLHGLSLFRDFQLRTCTHSKEPSGRLVKER